MLMSLLGTRVAINVLSRRGYGQEIRDDGPTTHHTKRGTPTMGGIVIIVATVVGYFAAKLLTLSMPSASALLLLFLFVGLGTVGFLDDFIKIAKQRSLGLRSKAKMIGQTVVALTFGVLALSPWLADDRGETPASHHLSFIRDFDSWAMPTVVVVLFIWLVITGTSNAVNLTDGLDGLAAGLTAIAAATFAVFAYIIGRVDTSSYLNIFYLRGAGELAVFCTAIFAANLGFLWFNSHPAQVFMGDTGSLALGGALGAIAILLKSEFLLLIIGAVFVAETLSVILQRSVFKYRRARFGLEYARQNRVFLRAPLHHHFEMKGWPETQVVVRFWILGILAAALALSTLKVR
ncbi:MAG TPA: phospho-N-acetylmuramoyl-pentapeptide-transferase [Nocardioides sp.]|nr:phospho-N-acetylmuramoyl-pentapeptide-transferase [Nocardioides sp.]